jgi:lipid-binding SYLF domain-containing protein
MKKTLAIILMGAFVIGGCSQRRNSANQTPATQNAPADSVAANRPEALDRLKDSANVLNELMAAPDDAIPETVLSKAECVMVVPSMVKGGFVIGGRHGRGTVTCRQNGKWSAPAFVTISGGSWGAQIGAEVVDLVLLFMNQNAVNALLKNNFKIGAEASVAAGPLGRQAAAGTDATVKAEILSYSRTRGLFAGLELSGAAVREDEDSMKGVYGREMNLDAVLRGNVPAPQGSQVFLSTVRKHFRDAIALAR